MGSANQATNRRTKRERPADDGRDAAARMVALQARIRELDELNVEQASLSLDTLTPDVQARDTQPASNTKLVETPHSNSMQPVSTSMQPVSTNDVGPIPTAPVTADCTGLRNPPQTRWPSASANPLASFAAYNQNDKHTLNDLARLTPVWLVSAAFHALLLVTLALITCTQTIFSSPIIIASARVEPDIVPELANDIEIGTLSGDEDLEAPSWDTDSLDPGPLDLGLKEELVSPNFSFELAPVSALAEQLDAARKLQGNGSRERGNDGTGVQFYGIQAHGDRFVFIVDSSTSMRMKFAEAKRELEYAVRGLSKDQLFYVIFFDRDAERLRLGKWNGRGTRFSLKTSPEPNLVPASNENIDSLVYWMNTIQLDSDTNPHPAVTYALRKLKPDAIFLLSDGEFNDGGATEAFLKRENVFDHSLPNSNPITVVHCVGFYSRLGEVTLKRIAEDNGGTYRFIEPPRGIFISPAFRTTLPRR